MSDKPKDRRVVPNRMSRRTLHQDDALQRRRGRTAKAAAPAPHPRWTGRWCVPGAEVMR